MAKYRNDKQTKKLTILPIIDQRLSTTSPTLKKNHSIVYAHIQAQQYWIYSGLWHRCVRELKTFMKVIPLIRLRDSLISWFAAKKWNCFHIINVVISNSVWHHVTLAVLCYISPYNMHGCFNTIQFSHKSDPFFQLLQLYFLYLNIIQNISEMYFEVSIVFSITAYYSWRICAVSVIFVVDI